MWTTAYRDAVLDAQDGASLLWTPYVSLLTAVTDWRAGTVTEASYPGYGRVALSQGIAGNTSPTAGRQKSNDAAVTFSPNGGSSQDVMALGLHTASSGGSLYKIAPLGSIAPKVGVANDTSTEDLIVPAHGFTTDLRVFVLSAPGMTLPTGLSENTAYYVLAAGLTTDQFRVSTTSGGAAVNITAKGAFIALPYTAQTIAGGETPQFAIAALLDQA